MSNDKDIQQRVDDMSTTTFYIAGCPVTVFKRFLAFCEDNAKVTKIIRNKEGKVSTKSELCYAIGLAKLLDAVEADVKTMMFYNRLVALEDQVAMLMSTRDNPSEAKEDSKFKVFGGGKE